MSQPAPWSQPQPPSTFDINDHAGEVALIVVGGYHERVSTRSFGEKPAVRCTVLLLTGRNAGKAYDDVMLFAQRLVSQFEGVPQGHVNLCRIVKRDRSITFETYSAYDEQIAASWMAAHPGQLDRLRADAIRNFNEQSIKVAQGLAMGGGNVPASPQWTHDAAANMVPLPGPSSAGPPPGWAVETPPPAPTATPPVSNVEQSAPPAWTPPPQQSATMASLINPGPGADPSQTGF